MCPTSARIHNGRGLCEESRVNGILLEPGELHDDGKCELSDARGAHIVNVLHAAPGQPVRIGVLDGPRGVGVVRSVEGTRVVLECTLESAPPPSPRIDLLLAMPRPKVMKRLWAPLASLGVGSIIVTNAAKVERNYFDASALDEMTWRPLLVEGLTQASDTRVPVVHVRRRFRPLVEDELGELSDAKRRIVADPGGTERLITRRFPSTERVLLAVGPEGGWTPFELALLRERGFEAVSVGQRILRTDTACVALLGILSETLAGVELPA